MNPIVEREITHVGQVMRASVLSCAPKLTLVDYWRRRIMGLLEVDGLTHVQLCSLRDLLRELQDIERVLEDLRAQRVVKIAPGTAPTTGES
jgi:hypothetical protein